ncbi:hypothetical protein F8274_03065 [Micromonospora sp. AMSO31t]|nr:hypothetical protein F8274_03065 [Micromonospora sp. AMSO31t]
MLWPAVVRVTGVPQQARRDPRRHRPDTGTAYRPINSAVQSRGTPAGTPVVPRQRDPALHGSLHRATRTGDTDDGLRSLRCSHGGVSRADQAGLPCGVRSRSLRGNSGKDHSPRHHTTGAKSRLRALQRRLLAEVLGRIPVHLAAHGFVPGRSAHTFAAAHAAQPVVVRIDPLGFFTHIPATRVHGLFRTAGYPEPVAHTLTGLCTTRTPHPVLRRAPTGLPHRATRLAALGTGHLPQGAPTSPALANLCAYRLDRRLTGLADAFETTYTRYADDLAFSGNLTTRRIHTRSPPSPTSPAKRASESTQPRPASVGAPTGNSSPDSSSTTTPPHHATNTTSSAPSSTTPPAPASPPSTGPTTPTSLHTSSDEFSESAITTRHAQPNSPRCWPKLLRHRRLTRRGSFAGSRQGHVGRPKRGLSRTYTCSADLRQASTATRLCDPLT